MFYHYPVTIPKSTAEAAATKTIMNLPAGEIHQVEIGFPWGCAGLAHVQIYHSEHQMWPSNPGESFAWNDYTVVVRIGVLEKSRTMFGKIAQALFGGPAGR